MLIQLAPEYWMAVFDFLIQHRRAVAEKISQFGDRQFSDLCQHWLHERTKNVQLNNLIVHSTGVKSCLKWTEEQRSWTNVPVAQVPMPENIVGFKRIIIKDLTSEGLNFLRRMSTLFTNIRLEFCSENVKVNNNAMVVFDRLLLLPLFNGITEIALNGTRPFFEHIQKRFPSAILEKASLIHFLVDEGLLPNGFGQFIANLLFTKRESGNEQQARKCAVIGMGNGVAAMTSDQLNQLVAIIRENFLAATTPTSSSFIFSLFPSSTPEPINAVQEFRIENGTTGEQLIVQKRGGDDDGTVVSIIRCPSVVHGDTWIQQHRLKPQSDRVVSIFYPEIGELKDEEDSKEEKDEEESEQPGPSKDRN